MENDALIHLRVPAATKARWVRESRAAGMRLTEWVVERVEPETKNTPTHNRPGYQSQQPIAQPDG